MTSICTSILISIFCSLLILFFRRFLFACCVHDCCTYFFPASCRVVCPPHIRKTESSIVPPTFSDYSRTEAFSKVICWSWMYPIHILLVYLLVFFGIVAFLSRAIDRLAFLHVHAGRGFLITMLWAIASSILIHNTGLPRSIFFFFVLMLACITIGFNAIRFAQKRYADAVVTKADELLKANRKLESVKEILNDAAVALDQEPKTWRQRLFSLKALHGLMMTIAWYQMFGRAMITDPSNPAGSKIHREPFKCWTYPAIKNADGTIELVPEIDPEFSFNGTEVQFAVAVSVPAILFFIFVGVAWSCVASRRQAAHLHNCDKSVCIGENGQKDEATTTTANTTTASADDEMETTDENN